MEARIAWFLIGIVVGVAAFAVINISTNDLRITIETDLYTWTSPARPAPSGSLDTPAPPPDLDIETREVPVSQAQGASEPGEPDAIPPPHQNRGIGARPAAAVLEKAPPEP